MWCALTEGEGVQFTIRVLVGCTSAGCGVIFGLLAGCTDKGAGFLLGSLIGAKLNERGRIIWVLARCTKKGCGVL